MFSSNDESVFSTSIFSSFFVLFPRPPPPPPPLRHSCPASPRPHPYRNIRLWHDSSLWVDRSFLLSLGYDFEIHQSLIETKQKKSIIHGILFFSQRSITWVVMTGASSGTSSTWSISKPFFNCSIKFDRIDEKSLGKLSTPPYASARLLFAVVYKLCVSSHI